MQTSAKTKAKEFIKQNHPLDISEYDIEKLLLEHERDTRYTAIDVILSMEQSDIKSGSELFGTLTCEDGVITEDAIQKIHNMKVGE